MPVDEEGEGDDASEGPVYRGNGKVSFSAASDPGALSQFLPVDARPTISTATSLPEIRSNDAGAYPLPLSQQSSMIDLLSLSEESEIDKALRLIRSARANRANKAIKDQA